MGKHDSGEMFGTSIVPRNTIPVDKNTTVSYIQRYLDKLKLYYHTDDLTDPELINYYDTYRSSDKPLKSWSSTY
jgi:hypothetical protein